MEFGNNNLGNGQNETVINAVDKFKDMPSPENLFKAIVGIILLLAVIFGTMGAFYKVGTEETGVVLRFGKYVTLTQPGLHFKMPFGIDRIILVKTGRVLKEEFGFRSLNPGIRTTYNKQGYEEESLLLTGDLNVSDLEWIVQYQIANPFKFLFSIKNARTTIRDISEAVVRKVIGNSNVTDVLTTERSSLAAIIQKELQQILNDYDIGVRIVTVKFQDVNPPEKVKAAFNGVNEAEQQKESLILQAREQYNKQVPRAKGEAKRVIQEAEGYALERVNMAKGEVQRFSALLSEYKKYPEVTKKRIYLETMEKVLPGFSEIYIMDSSEKINSPLPILPLNTNKINQGGSQ